MEHCLKILLLAFTIICLSTCSNVTPPPTTLLQNVIDSGLFRVITTNTPTTFYKNSDGFHGIEYKLAKGYADHIGVDLDIYIAKDFNHIFSDMADGNADVAAANLTVNQIHGQIVEYSTPYFQTSYQVIYRRNTKKPRSLSDLSEGNFEILSGSSYIQMLEDKKIKNPNLKWKEVYYSNIEDLLKKISDGELDYTITDANSFKSIQLSYPEAEVAFTIDSTESMSWALPKSNDTSLRDSINNYFNAIKKSGELNRIIDEHYFVSEKEFNYFNSRVFLNHYEQRLPKYRNLFEREAKKYNGLDWRLLAALSYQESHWNYKAVSPTGVRGLMMLTLDTAKMMGVDNRINPEESIIGGAKYYSQLYNRLPHRINDPDKTWFALAAYNVGLGHLEDARVITENQDMNPDSWNDVKKHLPLLSDSNWYKYTSRGYARGEEPVNYVANIKKYYNALKWLTANEKDLDSFENILVNNVVSISEL